MHEPLVMPVVCLVDHYIKFILFTLACVVVLFNWVVKSGFSQNWHIIQLSCSSAMAPPNEGPLIDLSWAEYIQGLGLCAQGDSICASTSDTFKLKMSLKVSDYQLSLRYELWCPHFSNHWTYLIINMPYDHKDSHSVIWFWFALLRHHFPSTHLFVVTAKNQHVSRPVWIDVGFNAFRWVLEF